LRLGSLGRLAYFGRVTGFLRYLGIVNAAVWLGGGVFLTFVAAPVFFSTEMLTLLGPADFPRVSGGIAQLVLKRYFWFHAACAGIALLILLLQRVLSGQFNRWALQLVAVLIGLTLLGGFWVAPKLAGLQEIRHGANTPSVERDAAAKSFRAWHGVSQVINLLVLGGLLVHLRQVSAPARRD
jgi:hypothetical protein